jgi:ferritin-like metal-binding protein YciE
MASVASLREHLVEELNDLLNAEQQLIEALPMMAEHASRKELQSAFRRHLAETKTHERRVTQALKALGEDASGKTCEAMEGLLTEGQELMSSGEPGALLDAMLITAAQKVEHYEIATYGTVRTYANVLGEKNVAKLLEQNLKDEKAADKKLTTIAEGGVNKQAAKEWHEQSSTTTDMLHKGAQWLGSTVGGAMKRVMPGQTASDRGAGPRRRSTQSRKTNGRSQSRSRNR